MFKNIILPLSLVAIGLIAALVALNETWYMINIGASVFRDTSLDSEVLKTPTVIVMAALTTIMAAIIGLMLWRVFSR